MDFKNGTVQEIKRKKEKETEKVKEEITEPLNKGKIALSEEGKSWCELNIDGFKEKREGINIEIEKRERMRTERIKN